MCPPAPSFSLEGEVSRTLVRDDEGGGKPGGEQMAPPAPYARPHRPDAGASAHFPKMGEDEGRRAPYPGQNW